MDAQDLSAATASNGSSPCTQNVLLDNGEDPSLQEHAVSVYFYLNGTTLSCTAQRAEQDIAQYGANNEWCAKNCITPSTQPPATAADFAPVDAPVALISNVVKLALSYGVDPDGDNAANYYADAATIPAGSWQDIISVRLSVVVRSAEDFLTSTILDYNVDGVAYTPDDHRLYKVFTTTIALRNQI